jgi:amidase
MAGPIRIEGIKAGDCLGARIRRIIPVGFGRQGPVLHRPQGGRLLFLENLSIPMEPSIGCIGLSPAPGEDEIRSSDSGRCGGNMDCRDIAEGATVFFKSRTDGASLCMGDVHLAMGDGEVEGQGVESAADATISVSRFRPVRTEWPWLVRNGELMCIAGDENISTAIHLAYEAMMGLGEDVFGMQRTQMQARIGPAGSVRICQSCCRIKTVRVCLPLSLLGHDQDSFIELIRLDA